MNCQKCDCPLTLLMVAYKRYEKRATCAQCRESMPTPKRTLLIEDMSLVKRVSRDFYASRKRVPND